MQSNETQSIRTRSVDMRRTDIMMDDWNEIRAWRRATRAGILSRRMAVTHGEKQRVGSVISDIVAREFPQLRQACIGFYWPFKAEIDLRHLVRDFLKPDAAAGAGAASAALPVVVEKQRPLEFWAWRPRMKMGRGIWNIPVPGERCPVRPTMLLVPLVGFDAAGYRLGYGGGYYDRTLARMSPRPLTIGIGYELGRLESIYPQPHDIPLDAIVTETGIQRFGNQGEAQASDPEMTPGVKDDDHPGYSSPPCFMHELDPAYLGYLDAPEVVAVLNELLVAGRAAARAILETARQTAELEDRDTLSDIADDEVGFCALLSRHITQLGGKPSLQTGEIYGKLISLDSSCDRIDLFARGQVWVVTALGTALNRIGDARLYEDLKVMLATHERNIRRCSDLLQRAKVKPRGETVKRIASSS